MLLGLLFALLDLATKLTDSFSQLLFVAMNSLMEVVFVQGVELSFQLFHAVVVVVQGRTKFFQTPQHVAKVDIVLLACLHFLVQMRDQRVDVSELGFLAMILL